MKISDIGTPTKHNRQLEIIVPLGKCYFDKLMKHLIKQGWRWKGVLTIDFVPPWVGITQGFIHLWLDGHITYSYHCVEGYDPFPIDIDDWDDSLSAPISSELFCICMSSKIERKFSGVGSSGEWYDFCINCKKERK